MSWFQISEEEPIIDKGWIVSVVSGFIRNPKAKPPGKANLIFPDVKGTGRCYRSASGSCVFPVSSLVWC